jgi:membrane protein DedA with SNARE-associated domain
LRPDRVGIGKTVEGLGEFFRSIHGIWGYVFLFLSSLGENLFPPLPGDTFLILGAVLVGRGQLDFLPAYLATTAGSLTGFMALFFIGRKWGRALFRSKANAVFSEKHLHRVESWFGKYGYGIIAVNRFLSGFRSVVSLGAGIAGMKPWPVFGLAVVSVVLWNALLMGVGIWVGENWVKVVGQYQKVVFALLAAVLLVWGIRTLVKQRKIRQQKDIEK